MTKNKIIRLSLLFIMLILLLANVATIAQQSVARQWNEALLMAIRNDFARPTVHARNLFHVSIALYDSWAVYDFHAETYLLGKALGNYESAFDGIQQPVDQQSAREETISYAAYRLLNKRFQNSPGKDESLALFDQLMVDLGYDISVVSIDYSESSASALGNYIASQIINYGNQDGSNEVGNYENLYYTPINSVLIPSLSGSTELEDPNRWQPLGFDLFIDQAGNIFAGEVPDFVSPEWGLVAPFALSNDQLSIYQRDTSDYWVYYDPGAPPYIDIMTGQAESATYKWGFELVSIWSSHLDSQDGIMWDISPASCGNIQSYPKGIIDYPMFYNLLGGGDPGQGYDLNPKTGLPYIPQIVPRGDYARVLAEFWADGPDSETPPGHWFTILNYVSDHPLIEKKISGDGPLLDDLEWDVKSYFLLGGAMHDAAIAAWGIKGWYDYIRPVSAIRSMASRGQSSDSTLMSYHVGGVDLVDGYIELVMSNDILSGEKDENVGKIKLFSWRGPDFIEDEEFDVAGVGWILADDWWPYQRPTFVTPPFAGYISGHSTYSRAAAEVMTMLTGDEYFPGGLGEFFAPKDEFLVFENGPSVDITLQWAKYKDASDQCSLSRIWGGIHPPADDIPGRKIGELIGQRAFEYGTNFFNGKVVGIDNEHSIYSDILVYPNPAFTGEQINIQVPGNSNDLFINIWDYQGVHVHHDHLISSTVNQNLKLRIENLNPGIYILQIMDRKDRISSRKLVVY